MSSSVIFNRLLKTPQLGVIYFFFNHSDRQQTAENVVRVLLRQLLHQLDTIPQKVFDEYARYKQDPRMMPNRETYTLLLKYSITELLECNYNQVFVLIDAYDELLSVKEVQLEQAAKERAGICFSLSSLTERGNVKILVTTRPQYSIELQNAFPKSRVVDLHGDITDMEMYLRGRLQRINLSDSLKDHIKDKLLQANEQDKW
jgi:hypothetical protein